MNYLSFIAEAESSLRHFCYSVELCVTRAEKAIDYQNTVLFNDLCQRGCKNYNQKWSCPPNSPTYSSFSQGWNNLYVIFLHTEMQSFSDIKNPYLRIKAANTMLKSRADRFIRKLYEDGGRPISTGSCRLCKPCHYKLGEVCAHPDVMTYSYEAMGIDVDALVFECFGKHLLWYKKGYIPEYTSVVCGYLSNQIIELNTLQDIYLQTVDE